MSALRRPLPWLAVLGAVSLVTAAVRGMDTPGPFGIQQPQVWALVGLLPGYLIGGVLVWLRPRERVPRLLLAMASSMAVATALGAVSSRLAATGEPSGWVWLLVASEYVFDLGGPAAMGAMFVLFPDGVVRRCYERRVLTGFAAVVAVLPVLLLLTNRMLPAPEYAASRAALLPSPLDVPLLTALGPLIEGLYHVGTQLGLLGAMLLVVRYRRLPARQRSQTYWLLLAAVAVLADVVVVQLLSAVDLLPRQVQTTTFYAVWVPALVFVPVAVVIALVRHRLFDVHLAVRASLLYGAVSAGTGAAFLLVTTALGVTAGRQLPLVATVVATIAVVLVLSPLRRRLDGWIGDRLYGERPTRAELLGEFGAALEHAYDLHELGPRVAAGIMNGLGLSWVRVLLVFPESDATELIGTAGPGSGDRADLVVPLVDRGEVVGRVECGQPVRGGSIGPEDRALLTTVSRQTALAVRNAHFSAELAGQLVEIRRQADALAESRRRLVDAQDIERRRLERDLHDGVQQQVVAVTALLRLGLDRLAREPEAAREVFEDARRTATEILTGLRALVQGIRPPVLADRGLLAAIEAWTALIPVGVVVDADPGVRTGRYGAEVEAAAYFLVSEALTNVLKHANAREVRVSLQLEGDRLRVGIADDGVGFVPADASGTGLAGLTDRIAAVGGTLRLSSRPGEGTRLRAELPVPRTADV